MNIGVVHVIWFFQLLGMGFIFLQSFAAGSTTELRQKLFKQNAIVQTPTLVWLSDRLCNWKRRVWLCYFNAWRNCFYCCHVMTFDWSCQLSSSRSNNLNLQKLTGHLFYNLAMRLKCTADDLSHRVTTKILAMAAILTKCPVLLWVCLWWVR